MTLKPAGVISSDDAPQTTIVSGGVRLLTMWSTVLVLALSVICEPVRIGLVVLMLNRRRPLLHLLTFLCGGYTMAGGVAMVTLVVLGATPLAGHFSVAEVQIGTGLIALLIVCADHKCHRQACPASYPRPRRRRRWQGPTGVGTAKWCA